MEHAGQQQTVTVGRGLFLVRYASAEDKARPPMVKVTPDPVPNKAIGFLLHPDHTEAVLWQPDSCLVVRALAPGKLSVEVIPMQTGGSVAATVKIEALSQGKAKTEALSQGKAAPPAPKPPGQGRSSNDFNTFRILGHVTGIGDVIVNANER